MPRLGFVTLSMIAKVVVRPTALGASVIAQDEQGRVLLVRHSYMPGWSLPGGGVGRNEPPETAALREMREEVGLNSSTPPELFGLYTRKVAWFSNVIALYRLRDVRITFRPNLEVRETTFCDPSCPPAGTQASTLRRLAELTGQAPRSPYW
ncbi:MAG TPA: NUDIX domain-containing protein [Rhizomicrobium sp.]|nr:NUDIX domain-containing protein [Rhizomicrobium sp.]